MKNTLIIRLLIAATIVSFIINRVDNHNKQQRLKAYYITVDSLQDEGYTYKAAVHIAMVKGGWIKPDKEYKALIED